MIVTRTQLSCTLPGNEDKVTFHEVPAPEGFIERGRSYHSMRVDFYGNLVAYGFTCCADRQHGCAYLGSCTAQRPSSIEMGHITDYPEVEIEAEVE